MRHCLTLVIMTGLTAVAPADSPKPAFRSAGRGLFEFNTGVLRGRLKVDGKYQGLYPLVDVASGADLTRPPGVFSFYRVFETNRRYGNAARDWPTVTRLLPDGAVEVVWPAAEEHPIEMTVVYRWTAPDTLDVETIVKPDRDMPDFEMFVSSYFGKGFRASVYVKPPGSSRPGFVPVDRTRQAKGNYVMFPRDKGALGIIRDGRWTIPPSPVDWGVIRWLAAPLAIRRDAGAGLTAVMMAPADDCFAIASPWNPPTPDSPGYRSFYLSLFGRHLPAGRSARARMRLVLGRDITDRRAVELYREYLGRPNAQDGP